MQLVQVFLLCVSKSVNKDGGSNPVRLCCCASPALSVQQVSG